MSHAEAVLDAVMDPLAPVLVTLRSYRALAPGWDGAGSLAPNWDTLDRAVELVKAWPLDLMLPTPMVSSDGTVGFYWDRSDSYIDAEFDDDGTLSVFVRARHHQQERFHEHLSLNDALGTVTSWVRHGV